MAENEEELKSIAKQLRKPGGEAANKVAEKMDAVNEPLFDLTLGTMKPDDGDQILEIGFGSGRFIQRLFRESDQVKVYGVDYSAEMLEMAKKNNRFLIDLDRLQLIHGDSSDLPYPDEKFDKVFCNMVTYFWDKPGEHLREIHRILKPGGRFYTGMRTAESMKRLPFTKFGFQLYSQKEWVSILEENGFKHIAINQKKDPELKSGEIEFPLESVCIAAEKQ